MKSVLLIGNEQQATALQEALRPIYVRVVGTVIPGLIRAYYRTPPIPNIIVIFPDMLDDVLEQLQELREGAPGPLVLLLRLQKQLSDEALEKAGVFSWIIDLRVSERPLEVASLLWKIITDQSQGHPPINGGRHTLPERVKKPVPKEKTSTLNPEMKMADSEAIGTNIITVDFYGKPLRISPNQALVLGWLRRHPDQFYHPRDIRADKPFTVPGIRIMLEKLSQAIRRDCFPEHLSPLKKNGRLYKIESSAIQPQRPIELDRERQST